jgi:hypothetical protein
MLLGFFAFPVMIFWISLYMQRVLHFSALITAVHMLPMAIVGILVNVSIDLKFNPYNAALSCRGFEAAYTS